MGANCPSAVPSLLRGCIDAYQQASGNTGRYVQIVNAAKMAVTELASLSKREQSRVLTTLQNEGIMLDVQLELAANQDDPIIVACLLLQNLSSQSKIDEQHRNASSNKRNEIFNVSDEQRVESKRYYVPVSLKELFKEKPPLLEKVVNFLSSQLASQVKGNESSLRWMKISLLLRAYTCLFLQSDMKGSMQTLMQEFPGLRSLISSVSDLVDEIQSIVNNETKPTSHMEASMELLLATSLVSLATIISCEVMDVSVKAKCEQTVLKCFGCPNVSIQYEMFLVRFGFAVKNSDAKAVGNLMLDIVEKSSGTVSIAIQPTLSESFLKICEWASTNEALQKSINSFSSPAPSALLYELKNSQSFDENVVTAVKSELRKLLVDSQLHSSMLMDVNMPEFVVEATKMLCKMETINLPIISPLQLETLASKVDLADHQFEISTTTYQFLFQVLYWFSYMDTNTSSFSSFDVRELSLKEILSTCYRLVGNSCALGLHLRKLISKHCPEIPLQRERWELVRKHSRVNFSTLKGTVDRSSLKRGLFQAITSCVTDPDTDPSGIMAERLFLFSRRQISDSSLFPTIVSALLSSPHKPTPFVFYSVLTRDPVALLKVPMRVWVTRGLRHILLSVLSCLLESNTAVINEMSPTNIVAEDLVSSRNVLVVRCVLLAMSTTSDSNPKQCPYMCTMTAHFLRRLIAKNRGVMAMLVKQSPALPDAALDWLVEFVPETMDDSSELVTALSEKGPMCARLTAASAILRIAIAHGHRHEEEAESLVYSALSHLVSSFFIIVGPVGVPVNVLVGEGVGPDVTQTSRKLTFRMLRSLLNVKGRQRGRLRDECKIALQKLGGLCKGESIVGDANKGVAGAVVQRRKALLRDIFDAVIKAANNMGSSVDL